MQSPTNRALTGVRANIRYSYVALERIASEIRRDLGISLTGALQPLDLFEDLHEIHLTLEDGTTVPLGGGVIDLEGSEGYTRYDRERKILEILASTGTYERLEAGNPRGTFFVAHELGHCILHTSQLIRLAQLPSKQQAAFHRGRSDHKPYEDTEWQANGFASAFLMPAQGLLALEEELGYLSPGLIARTFGTSSEAADYRLNTFGPRRAELSR